MAEDKQRVRIDVSVFIAKRPETGEEWIIRDDKYFDEQKRVAVADMEVALLARKSAGESEEYQAKWRERWMGSTNAQFAQAEALHKSAREHSERKDFTLLRPTYGQFLSAKGTANVLNEETGESYFDNNIFTKELLRDSIDGYKGNAFLDDPQVSPQVAQELARVLTRSVSQEDKRLPFLSSPLETP